MTQVSQISNLQIQKEPLYIPPPPSGTDANFVYTQAVPSDTWVVNHSLNKLCAVQILNDVGKQIEGEITWDSLNQVTVKFNVAIIGSVICN